MPSLNSSSRSGSWLRFEFLWACSSKRQKVERSIRYLFMGKRDIVIFQVKIIFLFRNKKICAWIPIFLFLKFPNFGPSVTGMILHHRGNQWWWRRCIEMLRRVDRGLGVESIGWVLSKFGRLRNDKVPMLEQRRIGRFLHQWKLST